MQAVRPEEEAGHPVQSPTMQAVRPEEEAGHPVQSPTMQAVRPVRAPTQERQ
jgi:hypothetical protein